MIDLARRASFALVPLLLCPLAAAQSYDFALDPGLSSTLLSSTMRLELPGTAIGSYDPTTNPTGTITCTSLFGSCPNTAISMDITLVADTEVAGGPDGGFTATLDLQNGVALISGLSIDALGSQSGVTDLTLELLYPTFRTQQPNSLFIGGFTLPLPLGQATVSQVTILQTGGAAPGVLTPTGVVDVYDFAALVPAEISLEVDLLGTPSSLGPAPTALPLVGSLDMSCAAPVLSLVAKQSGHQKVPDPLPGQTFEDLPLDLPTILPPGEVAHLLLDMTVGALDVGFTADLQWHALGTPACDVATYCTSVPNTYSSGAAIAATGSSSILLNDLTLTATGVPPFHAGRFIMGSAQAFTPFGDGYLCVGGNVRRFPVVFADTNGLATTALDFTDPSSPTLLIAPGSTWNFQLAFRDPLGGPLTFNTSDAMSVTFCP